MRRKLAASALFFLIIISFSACSDSGNNETVDEKANHLDTLRRISNNDNYAFHGYSSKDEIGTEELGAPVEVRFIDIEALQANGDPNANIERLIEKKDEVLYPVLVKGEMTSSIRVVFRGDEHEVLSTGSGAFAEDLFQMIRRLGLTTNDCFLLEVPGTELCFIEWLSTGVITVTPLYDNSALGLRRGVSVRLSSIAEALKQYSIDAKFQYEQMIPENTGRQYRPWKPEIYANEEEEPTNILLSVDLYPQQEDQWCWAATGRMTMLFAGGDGDVITECAQANDAFSETSCCENGGSSECDNPWHPLYQDWGFDASLIGGGSQQITLSFADLKSTLISGKPIAFLWKWNSGGGHYQVAVGYSEDDSTDPPAQYVLVNNPWPVNQGDNATYSYQNWLGGSNYDHTLTAMFTDIVKE